MFKTRPLTTPELLPVLRVTMENKATPSRLRVLLAILCLIVLAGVCAVGAMLLLFGFFLAQWDAVAVGTVMLLIVAAGFWAVVRYA